MIPPPPIYSHPPQKNPKESPTNHKQNDVSSGRNVGGFTSTKIGGSKKTSPRRLDRPTPCASCSIWSNNKATSAATGPEEAADVNDEGKNGRKSWTPRWFGLGWVFIFCGVVIGDVVWWCCMMFSFLCGCCWCFCCCCCCEMCCDCVWGGFLGTRFVCGL